MYYYVNTKKDNQGNNEVHTSTCYYLPSVENRQGLGYFNSPKEAVAYAKRFYPNADGCFHCCNSAHKQ